MRCSTRLRLWRRVDSSATAAEGGRTGGLGLSSPSLSLYAGGDLQQQQNCNNQLILVFYFLYFFQIRFGFFFFLDLSRFSASSLLCLRRPNLRLGRLLLAVGRFCGGGGGVEIFSPGGSSDNWACCWWPIRVCWESRWTTSTGGDFAFVAG